MPYNFSNLEITVDTATLISYSMLVFMWYTFFFFKSQQLQKTQLGKNIDIIEGT